MAPTTYQNSLLFSSTYMIVCIPAPTMQITLEDTINEILVVKYDEIYTMRCMGTAIRQNTPRKV